MTNNPLVSIITPCYNCESYLNRYFDSILNQTYNNVELIIVNDGSKDKTEEVVFSYKEKINQRGYKLKYLKQENQGIGGAINTGLKYIDGEYFAWCDSDNFYSKDYIESKVKFFLENPKYSIVRCDGYIVYDGDISTPVGKMSQGNTDLYQENLFENCIYEKNFHFGCAMIRTKNFDMVNSEREIYPSREGQNWQLLLPVFYRFKSGYIDKPMFYFVYRQDSVSNITKTLSVDKLIEQKNEYEKILEKTILSMKIKEENYYINRVKAKYAKIRIKIYGKHNMKLQAKLEYKKAKAAKINNASVKIAYLQAKDKIFDRIVSALSKMLKKLK